MADLIQSVWTITWDPGGSHQLVLVTAGDLIADEIRLKATQDTEEGKYFQANSAEPFARGGVMREVEITVYKSHASIAAARAYCFTCDLAVTPQVRATLRFAISGGNTYNLANAVFDSWETVTDRIGIHRTITTYRLTGGALS